MSGSNSSGGGRISDSKMEPQWGSNLHKALRFLQDNWKATCTIGFVQVPINRYTPEVQREDGNTWQEDSTVDISWDSGSIWGLDEEVSIDLTRYEMGHDDVPRTGQLPRSGKQWT